MTGLRGASHMEQAGAEASSVATKRVYILTNHIYTDALTFLDNNFYLYNIIT